jgi:hypothetical protein
MVERIEFICGKHGSTFSTSESFFFFLIPTNEGYSDSVFCFECTKQTKRCLTFFVRDKLFPVVAISNRTFLSWNNNFIYCHSITIIGCMHYRFNRQDFAFSLTCHIMDHCSIGIKKEHFISTYLEVIYMVIR